MGFRLSNYLQAGDISSFQSDLAVTRMMAGSSWNLSLLSIIPEIKKYCRVGSACLHPMLFVWGLSAPSISHKRHHAIWEPYYLILGCAELDCSRYECNIISGSQKMFLEYLIPPGLLILVS
jgi:hypothetical protein